MFAHHQHRRCILNQCLTYIFVLIVIFLIISIALLFFFIPKGKQNVKKPDIKFLETRSQHIKKKFNKIYENFSQWNSTLCSHTSHHRGPHQKVIAISVYGKQSKFTNNAMYSWETNIIPFFELLVNEINTLLPQWILRVYIDFTGSTKSQQEYFYNFSNVDVCDINNIPMFGSSLQKFLPSKMWRFLPIFDPYVDYLLSRDLDSPIIQRETETINMWLSNEQEKKFFYIARDNIEHGTFILGGLWGAALVRARHTLISIFQPMLIPTLVKYFHDRGDQRFLSHYVGDRVRDNSLIFDSYFCENLGGRPFLSQRPMNNCHLGCIRPCCSNATNVNSNGTQMPCPIECRPKEHPDWIYC